MSDSYPTDDDLERIKAWPLGDNKGLMDFVKPLWHFGEWGWKESETISELSGKPVRLYCLATGGWSGNESIVDALQANEMFWFMCWKLSRRGGYCEFEVNP